MAMTLSMVSLRGRGVLASVRRRAIHVGGFAVLSLLRRRLLRIKFVRRRHFCDRCNASVEYQLPSFPTSRVFTFNPSQLA